MTPVAMPPGAELAPESITARSKSSFLAGFAFMGEERRAAMVVICQCAGTRSSVRRWPTSPRTKR